MVANQYWWNGDKEKASFIIREFYLALLNINDGKVRIGKIDEPYIQFTESLNEYHDFRLMLGQLQKRYKESLVKSYMPLIKRSSTPQP